MNTTTNNKPNKNTFVRSSANCGSSTRASQTGGRRRCRAVRSFCECGRPKRTTASCCSRCSDLDGATNAALAVISALRTAGPEPQTVAEIAEDAEMSYAAVERWLSRNLAKGRILQVKPGRYALREDFRPCLIDLGNY